MKKIIILTIIVLVLFGLYKYLSYQPITGVVNSNADLIMFWGEGCPHCEKVKDYISTNKLDQKIKISLKEVYYNKDNQKELESTVTKCPEIDTKQGIGVPLAFDTKNQKCLYGDQPIIDWLVRQ
jgi:glutaredoxin